jgi:hypothetical protein
MIPLVRVCTPGVFSSYYLIPVSSQADPKTAGGKTSAAPPTATTSDHVPLSTDPATSLPEPAPTPASHPTPAPVPIIISSSSPPAPVPEVISLDSSSPPAVHVDSGNATAGKIYKKYYSLHSRDIS